MVGVRHVVVVVKESLMREQYHSLSVSEIWSYIVSLAQQKEWKKGET